jgi:chromosome segregation ATPase
MIPFLFGVIGLAIGAFAAYAVGGKNRQAAKHYKKVANELSDKYTNLDKAYHQLTNENTKKIDELNQARELIAQNTQVIDELMSRYENLDQEYHQIADEKKQHLDNLANSQQLITRNKQVITELNDKYGNLQKKYDELIAENTTQKELITEKTKIINELTLLNETLLDKPLLESVTNNNRESLYKPVLSIDLQQFEIKRGTKMVNFKDGKKRK